MKKNTKRTAVVSALIAVALALAACAPRQAYAVASGPVELGKTKSYVAYRLFADDKAALVVGTKGKVVTIPQKVKYKGQKYRVRGILALGKDARRVNLNAKIEACMDSRLWRCRVCTPYKSMYRWLKRTGHKRVTLCR